jgi:glycogen debranching enzyme
MPLMAWIDERHLHALGLKNAWGYNPVTFFAPDPRLAPGGFKEIAETIETLHNNDLQVIFDVVLNHTGEGDSHGPTLSFRGLDNATYYAHSQSHLINDSGCGNTVALNEPSVASYALAALRHWIEATGADGFRFDLATIMGRDRGGFRPDSRLLRTIENDSVLSQCILISEPWDVGRGGYQLGQFSIAHKEWNDKFRDDVRRFWRGDTFSANALATRLAGSSDVFSNKTPRHGINFIAAHDGFTLRDLVTFSTKNNHNNGEGNRDGKTDEVTWPGGRPRALLATLFLSQGIPMLTAGDELGRTQNGNNNAYAQDNDVTWLNWDDADEHLIQFTSELIALRNKEPLFHSEGFFSGEGKPFPDVQWFDLLGKTPDWQKPDLRFLGLMLSDSKRRIAIVCNGSTSAAQLPIAARAKHTWSRNFSSRSEPNCPAQSVSLFSEEQL